MKKSLALITGLALISITVLPGCAQNKTNVASPTKNTTQNTVKTDSTNHTTTGNQVASSDNTPQMGKSLNGTPTPKGVNFPQLNAKSLTGVSFSSKKIGFVSSKDNIYKTTDGGETWAKVYMSKDPILGIEAQYQPAVKEESVVAFTKGYLIDSSDGTHFKMMIVPANNENETGSNIEGTALLNNGLYGILNGGVVWKVNGESGSFYRTTLLSKVSSLTSTWGKNGMAIGYAVSGTSVYQSTDSQHWNKVFTAPIHGRHPWKSTIQASGVHVAVLFYGGDSSKSGTAYILYESNDNGKTWKVMLTEPDFASDYKGSKPLDKTIAGQIPGSFTMDAKGDVFITGVDMVEGHISILTSVSPEGKTLTHDPIGPSVNSLNIFDGVATDISTAVGRYVYVVGGKNGKGVLEISLDGGLMFKQQ